MNEEREKRGVRVAILHGSIGNPEGNWFPWLKEHLESQGIQAIVPRFPTPEGQSFNNWREVFLKEVGPLSDNLLLIGHSTGALLALKLLNETASPIAATVLVAGFVSELGSPIYDELNDTFFPRTVDWTTIRQNAGELIIFAGDNDPYVPLAQSESLAQLLDQKLQLIPDGGHLNSESGYLAFPELLTAVKKILNQW